jgi:hypothetical protein
MANEWISIKQKHPKEHEKVLVCSEIGVIDCGWVFLCGLNIWKFRNSHSYLNNITHWMPLPKNPYL